MNIHIDQPVTSPPLIERLQQLYREYVIYGGYPRVALETSSEVRDRYLAQVISTYIIQLVRPFSRNIRSELFKVPKVFFHDTGIAHLLWLKAFPKTIQGSMFENSVFSELRKNPHIKSINYWRTKSGQEIDFIIPSGQSVVPVEVKQSAVKVRGGAIRYFNERYSPQRGYCITLNKRTRGEIPLELRYPWEPIEDVPDR